MRKIWEDFKPLFIGVPVVILGGLVFAAGVKYIVDSKTTPSISASDSAELLCEKFGGLNRVRSKFTSTAGMYVYKNVEVECKDGSRVSRTTTE